MNRLEKVEKLLEDSSGRAGSVAEPKKQVQSAKSPIGRRSQTAAKSKKPVRPKRPAASHIKAAAAKSKKQVRPLPVRKFSHVFHIGTFDIQNRKDFSYEGAGLSVSRDPEAWYKIAKLGGNTLFVLTKANNAFIDAHKLTTKQWAAVMQFGEDAGFVTPTTLWRSYHYDDNDERGFSLHESEAKAARESEEIEAVSAYAPTPKLEKQMNRKCMLIETNNHVLEQYAEKHGYDGVWWQDILDVSAYSAPRGVIVQSKLSEWTVKQLSSRHNCI